MEGDDAAGGSLALAELIDKYGEYIFSDLLEYRGLNLVELIQPGSGWSPLMILTVIKHLPIGCKTKSHMRPGGGSQFEGWGMQEYQMANLIDAVRENTYATIMAAGPKRKPKAPEPSYRPEKAAKGGKPNMFTMMAQRRLQAVKKARGG